MPMTRMRLIARLPAGSGRFLGRAEVVRGGAVVAFAATVNRFVCRSAADNRQT